MSKLVGVLDVGSGAIDYHAAGDPGGANYDTLCGISLTDDQFKEAPVPRGQKINCASCHSVWILARTFRAADFKGVA